MITLFCAVLSELILTLYSSRTSFLVAKTHLCDGESVAKSRLGMRGCTFENCANTKNSFVGRFAGWVSLFGELSSVAAKQKATHRATSWKGFFGRNISRNGRIDTRARVG